MSYIYDKMLCAPVEVLSELGVDRVVDNGIDQCCRHCQEVDCKVDILDAVVISNAWRGTVLNIVLNTYWTFIHCHCCSKTQICSLVTFYL